MTLARKSKHAVAASSRSVPHTAQESSRDRNQADHSGFGASCHRPFAGQSCSPPSCLSGVDDYGFLRRLRFLRGAPGRAGARSKTAASERVPGGARDEGLSRRAMGEKSGIAYKSRAAATTTKWGREGARSLRGPQGAVTASLSLCPCAAAATPGSATGPTAKRSSERMHHFSIVGGMTMSRFGFDGGGACCCAVPASSAPHFDALLVTNGGGAL